MNIRTGASRSGDTFTDGSLLPLIATSGSAYIIGLPELTSRLWVALNLPECQIPVIPSTATKPPVESLTAHPTMPTKLLTFLSGPQPLKEVA